MTKELSIDEERRIRKILWFLILFSVVVRSFIAASIELGNDEVYYWTYARFPDWSHFDHPPMVGLMIQFFTLNLHFSNEFFLRLGSIFLGTLNTYIIYLIGKQLKDSLTGLYAAFLFTSSIYCLIISGTFIMPDTPQVFFWLITIYLLLRSLPDKSLSGNSRLMVLLSGVTIGLALLSKYHSVFLIPGAFFYILFFNRKWFKTREIYISLLLAILFFLPVMIWNSQNEYISFTFHEGRVEHSVFKIRWDYFLTEILGQFFYNNPVNVIIIVAGFISLFRKKEPIGEKLWLILFMSLPLWMVFVVFSFFSSTLPHWTGPAYLGFILIGAEWISNRSEKKVNIPMIPWQLRVALILPLIIIFLGVSQINYGWIPFKRFKSDDFSTQLYGWKQLGRKFHEVADRDSINKKMPQNSPVLTFRWFPAANLDYYVATPTGHPLYAIGTLSKIHKYYWIDKNRGNLQKGISAYYIVLSDDYQSPHDILGNLFDSISVPDTIPIIRQDEVIRKAFVYRLYGLKKEIRFNKFESFVEPDIKRIRYWEKQIMTHPEWVVKIREKAKVQGRTFEDQVWQEAKWFAEKEILE